MIRVWLLVGMSAGSALSGCGSVPSRVQESGFIERTVTVDARDYRYRVFVPAAGAREARAPVVLFLHGTGERGSDGEKPTRVGIGPYVRTHTDDFPAIVVFPQAPDGYDWKGLAADIAFAALDDATRAYGGDPDRTYLTGLSMGGYGVWELALMQPQRFAALVPVCGGLPPPPAQRHLFVPPLHGEADPAAALAQRLKHVPIWIFHGAKDDVVPPRESREIFEALKAADDDVRYTEFPDANHNSWDPAYSQTPTLWEWLFAQRRK
ncbi:MAG: phospholipase [Lysobacteraceae bacterium]|nr:MAG: phospholipase [Xanthomonadaceae bacterium]